MGQLLRIITFGFLLSSMSASAETISWVDFSSWSAGASSGSGFESSSGIIVDAAYVNTSGMRSGRPRSGMVIVDDNNWPFYNNDIPVLSSVSASSRTLVTDLTLTFSNQGGLPPGGSIGILDLERTGSFVKLTGFRNGASVDVNWTVAYFQTEGVNASQPIWDSLTNTLTGTISSNNIPTESNNFAFLITDTRLDSVLLEITARNEGMGVAVSNQSLVESTLYNVPFPLGALLALSIVIVVVGIKSLKSQI